MFVNTYISNWLKKKIQPKNRCMYACLHGKYIGKMFVYINCNNNLYNFLILPDMKNITILENTVTIKTKSSENNINELELLADELIRR